jgi:hypothetical protein
MPNRRAFREAALVENFREKQALFILSCCIAPPLLRALFVPIVTGNGGLSVQRHIKQSETQI